MITENNDIFSAIGPAPAPNHATTLSDAYGEGFDDAAAIARYANRVAATGSTISEAEGWLSCSVNPDNPCKVELVFETAESASAFWREWSSAAGSTSEQGEAKDDDDLHRWEIEPHPYQPVDYDVMITDSDRDAAAAIQHGAEMYLWDGHEGGERVLKVRLNLDIPTTDHSPTASAAEGERCPGCGGSVDDICEACGKSFGSSGRDANGGCNSRCANCGSKYYTTQCTECGAPFNRDSITSPATTAESESHSCLACGAPTPDPYCSECAEHYRALAATPAIGACCTCICHGLIRHCSRCSGQPCRSSTATTEDAAREAAWILVSAVDENEWRHLRKYGKANGDKIDVAYIVNKTVRVIRGLYYFVAVLSKIYFQLFRVTLLTCRDMFGILSSP